MIIDSTSFINILKNEKDKNFHYMNFDFFYSNITKIESGRAFFMLDNGSESEIGFKSLEPDLSINDFVLIARRGQNDFLIIGKIQDVNEVF
jgi:hypothetical protein